MTAEKVKRYRENHPWSRVEVLVPAGKVAVIKGMAENMREEWRAINSAMPEARRVDDPPGDATPTDATPPTDSATPKRKRGRPRKRPLAE